MSFYLALVHFLPLFAFLTTFVRCDPLILTPLIKANKLAEAKNLSLVRDLPNAPVFESYSGYLTVDEKYNSNMFFWFFPSIKNPKTSPFIVYLEGGPGASSLMSVFLYGPIQVEQDMNVTSSPWSWTQEFSMIYIDNPVGVGFSFTNSTDGLSTNETTIADHLYEVLQQFYTVFHEYKDNELYIAGLSYAGKYVPSLGHKLMKMSKTSKMNFKGVAIGNGLIDPKNQMNYSTLFKGLGLIDEKQRKQMQELEEIISKQIKAEEYLKAMDYFKKLTLNVPNAPSLLFRDTGYQETYNLLKSGPNSLNFDFRFITYLNENNTKRALHVGHRPYEVISSAVQAKMQDDFLRSVEPNLTELIGKYKVLLFNGNLDISVGVTLLNGLLENKDWKYCDNYYHANRTVWKVNKNDTEVAGYSKSFEKFTHVVVRNSGHCAMCEQPRATFDLIKRFIYSRSFEN